METLLEIAEALAVVVFIFFNWLYQSICISAWQTTLGKKIFKLAVVNINDNNGKISFGQAARRAGWRILSESFFLIGYWGMNKEKYKQAFHDKKAQTIVLRRNGSIVLGIILAVLAALFIYYINIYW